MPDEQKEEYGVTIGEIFHKIFSQKLVAIIVAVVVFVACTVAIYFGYSLNQAQYSVSFTLSLPNSSVTSSYCPLPDGSRFYYSDYVSEEVLAEIVNSDSRLSYINYSEMAQQNDIYLTEESLDTDDETDLDVTTRGIFTITVKQKYFNSVSDAKLFLTLLAEYPITSYININATMDYNSYLNYDDFANALTFAEQIEYIQMQINYIQSLYEALPSSATTDSGITVTSVLQSFNAWVARVDIDAVISEAETYYYCKEYETQLEKYQNELLKANGLYEQYYDALEVYNGLVDAMQGVTSTEASTFATLLENISALKRQITVYENYISAYYETERDATTGFLVIDETTERIKLGALNEEQVKATEAYAGEIAAIYKELTMDGGYIDQYVELNEMICQNLCSVNYQAASKIESNDSIGVVLSIIVSLVIAVIIACIAAYIVASNKSNKKAKTEKDRG